MYCWNSGCPTRCELRQEVIGSIFDIVQYQQFPPFPNFKDNSQMYNVYSTLWVQVDIPPIDFYLI